MFQQLTGLAIGIVIFAIVIGVGVTVLTKFGGAVATCPAGETFAQNDSSGINGCQNDTTASHDPTNTAWTSVDGLITNLGTAGLAGWAAAIIALAVGLLFIGALMGKKSY